MDEKKQRNQQTNDFGNLLRQRHAQNHQQYLQDGTTAQHDNKFGRFIRAARKNATLTRDDLATMTALPTTTIAGIEYGTITGDDIEVDWVYDLAKALDKEPTTLNLLLNREPDPAIITKWIESEDNYKETSPFYRQWWKNLAAILRVTYQHSTKMFQGRGGWLQNNWQPILASGTIALLIAIITAQFFLVEIPLTEQKTDAVASVTNPNASYPVNTTNGHFHYDNLGNINGDEDPDMFAEIEALHALGIISGYSDSVYRYLPDSFISRGQASIMMARSYPGATATAPYEIAKRSDNINSGNRVVSEASFIIITNDVIQMTASMEVLVSKHNGIWLGENTTPTSLGNSQTTIIFEISPENFNDAIEQIRVINGTIITESIVAQKDVTSQYVDLEARLNNLELAEIELQELLDSSQERNDSAEEILNVHTRLVEIRGQIEQLIAQIAILEQSIEMSRITVTLIPEEEELGFQPAHIFENAWATFISFLQWIASGLLWVLAFFPVIIVTLILIAIVWHVVKRRNSS